MINAGDKMLKWEPSDGGWAIRVTSTTTEWIMAALLDLYFFTFVPEFKKIDITGPKVMIQLNECKHLFD